LGDTFVIMEIKFKQWGSAIPLISTKQSVYMWENISLISEVGKFIHTMI
jgi:hypothetical protein